MALNFGEADFEKLLSEGFREGHEDGDDVSSQSAFFDNLSYFVGWIGELPIELHALRLTIGFNNNSPMYPPLGYSVKQPHFPDTSSNMDLTHGTN